MFSLAGAVFFGRLTFILSQLAYFQERPSALRQPWLGGLTYHGALVGCVIGIWFWQRWSKESAWGLLDQAAPIGALLFMLGWLACWLEGCAFGAEAGLGLFRSDLPDNFGVFAVRFQTQRLGIIWGTLVLIIISRLYSAQKQRGDNPNGRWFLITLSLLTIGHGALTFLRGDAVPIIWGLRIDSWLDISILIGSLFLLQYKSLFEHGSETNE